VHDAGTVSAVAQAPDPLFDELRAAISAALVATEARQLALRRELDEIVESASLTNTDDEHDPDGATLAYERARTAALLAQAGEHLERLRRSLDGLEAGDYGRCRACGRYIGVERLLARPSAELCIGCARAG
jgi:RNA polymerase-binding transcription factor DksA